MGLCFCLLLPSCVAAQPPYYNANQQRAGVSSTPQAAFQASPSVRRGTVSNYVGVGDGSQISVKLSTANSGLVRADGGVSGVGGGFCAGSFSGSGTFRGQSLIVRDETVPECTFTLTRSGRRLTVQEGPQCIVTHGMSCGFSGVLTQK